MITVCQFSVTIRAIYKLAPGEGTISNAESDLISEWNRNNKDFPEKLERALTPQTSQALFDTLADWNTYLEEHTPSALELLR